MATNARNTKIRRWCFTINNPHAQLTQEDFDAFEAKYLISGLEIGDSGTHHLQGYIELKKPQRLANLRKMLGNGHFEPLRGTPEEASNYCAKDNSFVEFGNISAQGKRNDILLMRDAVASGKRGLELANDDSVCIPAVKYQRGLTWLIGLYEEIPDRSGTSVALIFGNPGLGKSYLAREQHADAYWKDNTKWWDGYTGQDVVVWDEFGGWSCTPHEFNKIFDKYPHRVESKGTSQWLRATKFIIISNFMAGTWWNTDTTRVNYDTIYRRINYVYWFRAFREYVEYVNYEEFSAATRGH